MTITYHATLDDAVAPGIVYFLRSKTAKTAKLRSAVSGAITCAIATVFVFRNEDVGWLSLAGLAGGMIGAALNYFTYEATFRRRFRKSQERELGGRLPAVVVYHRRKWHHQLRIPGCDDHLLLERPRRGE